MTQTEERTRPSGYIITSGDRVNLAQRVRRMWDYRRVTGLLVTRDLKVRYAGSILGWFWSILDPLLTSLVYWFVFTQIFQRRVGIEPYALFLVAGQLIWYWFNGGVIATVRALRTESQMVRSTNVPREAWVVRVVLSRTIEFLLSLPVLVVFAIAYLKAPKVEIVFLPVAMLMMMLLLTGIGLIVAPLNVLVPDVDRVVPIVLRIMFYLTPILYGVNNIPKHLRFIESFNPVAGIEVLFRASLWKAELYPIRKQVLKDALGHVRRGPNGNVLHRVVHEASNWPLILHSAIGCIVIFFIGLLVFTRLERPMLKEV